MRFESIHDVYADQIGDLRSAEQQLVAALPKMADAAADPELKAAFTDHLAETKGHLRRLDDIARALGGAVPDETCEGMRGLLREGEAVIAAGGDPAAKDAALIAAAQRVEHYEIAAYGTARTLADQLGLMDAQRLLDETLDEEADADKKLSKLATGGLLGIGINERAEH